MKHERAAAGSFITLSRFRGTSKSDLDLVPNLSLYAFEVFNYKENVKKSVKCVFFGYVNLGIEKVRADRNGWRH